MFILIRRSCLIRMFRLTWFFPRWNLSPLERLNKRKLKSWSMWLVCSCADHQHVTGLNTRALRETRALIIAFEIFKALTAWLTSLSDDDQCLFFTFTETSSTWHQISKQWVSRGFNHFNNMNIIFIISCFDASNWDYSLFSLKEIKGKSDFLKLISDPSVRLLQVIWKHFIQKQHHVSVRSALTVPRVTEIRPTAHSQTY